MKSQLFAAPLERAVRFFVREREPVSERAAPVDSRTINSGSNVTISG